jgi:hypothetical protein
MGGVGHVFGNYLLSVLARLDFGLGRLTYFYDL